jgi:hypothetical protein
VTSENEALTMFPALNIDLGSMKKHVGDSFGEKLMAATFNLNSRNGWATGSLTWKMNYEIVVALVGSPKRQRPKRGE